jgi:hypothetical protein
MDGEFGTCSRGLGVKKKSKKFKFKKLLRRGLGNLISGMIFAIGCVIVDRVDNWSQGEDKPEQVTVNSRVPTKALARSDHQ